MSGRVEAVGRVRALGGVLAAFGVSVTATRISTVALPWFVLVTTGSAARTGLVVAAELAPYVLVKALSGPIVDRIGPRRVSWVSDLLSAIAVGLVPLMYAAGLLAFPLLLAMVALIGAVRGPGDLAKSVMVPEAADRARVPLERATGLSGVVDRLGAVAGPAAGGTVVALFGSMTALEINAALFALGSVIIGLALPRGMGAPADPHTDDATSTVVDAEQAAGSVRGGAPSVVRRASEPGYWARFGAGFTFLRRQPLLLAIAIMIAVTNLLDVAYMNVLLPVWAKESGHGPAAIGLVAAVHAVSAVTGSLVATAIGERMPRRLVFFVGFLVAGAPRFLILAIDVPIGAVLAIAVAAGFGSGFLNPILGAITFELIPRAMLGRVRGLVDSLAWAGMPLGGLLAGAAVATVGLAPSLVAAGIAYFLTTNLAALRPEWRTMDRKNSGMAAEPG